MLLLVSALAHAADPDPSAAPPALPEDVRDTYDPGGHLIRHLVLRADARVEETTWQYDAAGRPSTRRTEVPSGPVVVETWRYDPDGHVVEHRLTADGVETLREVSTWVDGRLVRKVEVDPKGTLTTTTTYDAGGRAILVETHDTSGGLVARTISDRPPPLLPPTPVVVKISAGLVTNSDVRESDGTFGFEVDRIPKREQYRTDPLEFRASGSYTRSAFAGVPLTNETDGFVGADYNDMIGPLTAFLFTKVSRNPAASLDVDLLVAPVGAKVDLIRTRAFEFDASLAPVWNFRSISTPAGGLCGDAPVAEDEHCATSLYRASSRLRATVQTATFKAQDTIEYLPALNPIGGTLRDALDRESVFRNTLAVTIAMNPTFSLTESVLFVRDPTLAAQADCAADPDDLLCAGKSLQTSSALAFTHNF